MLINAGNLFQRDSSYTLCKETFRFKRKGTENLFSKRYQGYNKLLLILTSSITYVYLIQLQFFGERITDSMLFHTVIVGVLAIFNTYTIINLNQSGKRSFSEKIFW